MKRRPPGWKAPQDHKKAEKAGAVLLTGEDAQRAVQALLERMGKHPERFLFDVELGK